MQTELISDWRSFPAPLRGGVVCVGNFDGVHGGHAEMLATGKAEAVRRGMSFTIMTFDPHPATVLRPGVARVPLTTTGQRVGLLSGFGPEVILLIPTTREFLGIRAEEFLERVLKGSLGARVLVEGPTFTYGRGAKGTVGTLQSEGPRFGIETVVVPTREAALSDLTQVKVSSSLIRWLIEQGRVRDAAICLQRPYTLAGTVVEGKHNGKGLGFPTANLRTTQLLPGAGIYAGVARVGGAGGRAFKAAISVGDNPTFHAAATTVEAHLLDFDEEIYGAEMEVEFHRWVREMLAFDALPPLIRRIERDVAETREVIGLGGSTGDVNTKARRE